MQGEELDLSAIVKDVQMRKSISIRKFWDVLFSFVALSFLILGLAILLLLIFQLFVDGRGLLFSWSFYTSFPAPNAAEAGILSAFVGSLFVICVTVLFAIPIGVAAGVYLEEYAKSSSSPAVRILTDFIEINITNLAGVPSIVYGLLGLEIFKETFKLGNSVLTAGMTLGILVLPVIVVTTREALKSVPSTLKEGSIAIGASKWQTIWDLILPASIGSILTGVIVSVSRAIGETAPLITVGALTFIAFLPPLPFSDRFAPDPQTGELVRAGQYGLFDWLFSGYTVMPIQMFDWVGRPNPEFRVNAAAAGVVLVLLTLVLNSAAIFLRIYFRRRIKW
ncbi:MAG: phosphate ABC transporter permease PstA [Oscillatoriales cyanobacterium SM2_2_1]|nr:phosphate ABC transporter permease PstA [Oscillatoriales cyanobacterium SM2_2_1]